MLEFANGRHVKLFTDGANVAQMLELSANPLVSGFTTNPTLMRRAGVDDYAAFVKELTARITEHPISFEVISDDLAEMERQARFLHAHGENVFVKIPITNSHGETATPLMSRLAAAGVSVNATALTTLDQVREVCEALRDGPSAIVSVFAGRIADSGVEPGPVMAEAKSILRSVPSLELLWASPREVLNVVQAANIDCDIITLTPDLFAKIQLLGRDLSEFSLATVRMFYEDAIAARYHL